MHAHSFRCVVWTGDDRVFFFNPTIHLSVWEKPGDLIGRDISRIIEDPPHKRKNTPAAEDDDTDDKHRHKSKRSRWVWASQWHSIWPTDVIVIDWYDRSLLSLCPRTEESVSLVPRPGDVQLLPLDLRVAHFREMMLERGVMHTHLVYTTNTYHSTETHTYM